MAESKALPSAPREKDEFADYRGPDEASFDRFILALDRAYHRPWLMMWRAFLHGMMSAIGAAVGAVLIVVLTGYVLNRLGGVELLRPLVNRVQEMIIQTPAFKGLSDVSQQSQQLQDTLNDKLNQQK